MAGNFVKSYLVHAHYSLVEDEKVRRRREKDCAALKVTITSKEKDCVGGILMLSESK